MSQRVVVSSIRIRLITFPFIVLEIFLLGFPRVSAEPLELISPNEQSGGEFGWSADRVPDVNGDGTVDLVVGAPRENPGESPRYAGRAYLFDGATGDLLGTFRSPNEEIDGLFGFAVRGLPDIDGDGRGDLLIGTESEDPGSSPDRAGRAYVFSGHTGEFIHELVSPSEEVVGEFGQSVSGIPDVNGDNKWDLLVGANQESPGTRPHLAGRAHIFDGSTGVPLTTLVSPNEQFEGHFGGTVLGLPDLNGNGSGEALVGASFEDTGNYPFNVGAAHLFDGSTGQLIRTLQSPDPEAGGYFGSWLSMMEDLNGNGSIELMVGAGGEDGGPYGFRGKVYVFDSSSFELIHELVSPNAQNYDHFGWASGIPDLSGDGIWDIVAGGWDEGRQGERDGPFYRAGFGYLFCGLDGSHLATLVSPNRQRLGFLGYPTVGLPDMNEDGLGDFMIGAYREFNGAGRVYLFRSPFYPPEIEIEPPSISFKFQQIGAGPGEVEDLTVRNRGGDKLFFHHPGIEIVGDNSDNFLLVDLDWSDISGPSGTFLNPGEELRVSVAFDPMTPASTKRAQILVTTNDPNEGLVEVPLYGEAVPELPTPTESQPITPSLTPTPTIMANQTPTPTHSLTFTPTFNSIPTDTPLATSPPTKTPTWTMTHTSRPTQTPTAIETFDPDILPDGRVDSRDLLEFLSLKSETGTDETTFLFSICIHWRETYVQ